jgi:hypothetical protein
MDIKTEFKMIKYLKIGGIMKRATILAGIIFLSLCLIVWGAVPSTLNDFFLPGSQPGQSGNLETPDKCDNCHGGYNIAVEPAFGWRGSMMAQAARDPLFYACMTIGNQDAPESGDLCIRCHSPAGWLEGRSTPTDGSALNNNDREGVQCDFCHKLVKPTPLGVNPYPDDPDYTSGTYPLDQIYLGIITDIPPANANGAYVADDDNLKRGPFVDAQATHQFQYSPFHSESGLCGTCHDVSSPVYSKDSDGKYVPNDFDQPTPDYDPYTMFPIERTFSEWKMSEYNSALGVYAPQFGGNKDTVSTCQDCHMRDATGKGCNKSAAFVRENLPLHDLTGGNTFIPLTLDALFPNEISQEALDTGIQRAVSMLRKAASMQVSANQQDSGYLTDVMITNETGHKLPSGYPEGRRIWINVQALNAQQEIIYESGAYDFQTAELTHDSDIKVYEIKPGISNSLAPIVNLIPGPSFHFVLNDTIYKDNRIPPRGFTNANFEMIQSPVINYSYPDGQFWDNTEYLLPLETSTIIVNLYYQITSKDYVEFLRDENVTNDWGDTFYNLWAANGRSAPELMNSDTIYVTPIAENQPPVLDSIGPKDVNEGSNLNFAVTAFDPDGTIPALTTSGLPDGATFVDSANGTATFDWTPGYDQADVYDITFYATDDSAAVDSETVVITVNDVNRPPVLLITGDSSVAEGDTLIILLSATDPDLDSLWFGLDPIPGNAIFTDSGNNTAVFIFAPDYSQAGNYSLIFSVTDGSLSDYANINITVINTNLAPVLAEIGNKEIEVGQTLDFSISAYDPDNDSIILSASQLPNNADFTDNGDGSGSFNFTPESVQIGTHEITFYAADIFDAVDSETIQITVFLGNQPPILDPIGDKSGFVEQLISFQISAHDPNGDSVALSADNLPSEAAFSDEGWNDTLGKYTGLFTWTPGQFQTGSHDSIHFMAADGSLLDEEYISINVSGVSYICGDANSDSTVNVSDAVFLINYVFIQGSPPPDPYEAGEVNCDGTVNVSDAVWIINYVFVGGNDPCDSDGNGIPDC